MQVIQIEEDPPNTGNKNFATIGCNEKSKNAFIKAIATYVAL